MDIKLNKEKKTSKAATSAVMKKQKPVEEAGVLKRHDAFYYKDRKQMNSFNPRAEMNKQINSLERLNFNKLRYQQSIDELTRQIKQDSGNAELEHMLSIKQEKLILIEDSIAEHEKSLAAFKKAMELHTEKMKYDLDNESEFNTAAMEEGGKIGLSDILIKLMKTISEESVSGSMKNVYSCLNRYVTGKNNEGDLDGAISAVNKYLESHSGHRFTQKGKDRKKLMIELRDKLLMDKPAYTGIPARVSMLNRLDDKMNADNGGDAQLGNVRAAAQQLKEAIASGTYSAAVKEKVLKAVNGYRNSKNKNSMSEELAQTVESIAMVHEFSQKTENRQQRLKKNGIDNDNVIDRMPIFSDLNKSITGSKLTADEKDQACMLLMNAQAKLLPLLSNEEITGTKTSKKKEVITGQKNSMSNSMVDAIASIVKISSLIKVSKNVPESMTEKIDNMIHELTDCKDKIHDYHFSPLASWNMISRSVGLGKALRNDGQQKEFTEREAEITDARDKYETERNRQLIENMNKMPLAEKKKVFLRYLENKHEEVLQYKQQCAFNLPGHQDVRTNMGIIGVYRLDSEGNPLETEDKLQEKKEDILKLGSNDGEGEDKAYKKYVARFDDIFNKLKDLDLTPEMFLKVSAHDQAYLSTALEVENMMEDNWQFFEKLDKENKYKFFIMTEKLTYLCQYENIMTSYISTSQDFGQDDKSVEDEINETVKMQYNDIDINKEFNIGKQAWLGKCDPNGNTDPAVIEKSKEEFIRTCEAKYKEKYKSKAEKREKRVNSK